MTIDGDLNQDGKVDAQDLEILKNLLKNSDLIKQLPDGQKAMLDVNNDGEVSYEDVVKLYQILIKADHPDLKPLQDKFNTLREKMRAE